MTVRWAESDLALKGFDQNGSRAKPGTGITATAKRANKYRNVPTDGFASAKEAKRYHELKLLERAGKITNLALQVKFSLDVEGVHICNYFADFCYDDEHGNVIVEDVKSKPTRTAVYRLKRNLMRAIYKIEISEYE